LRKRNNQDIIKAWKIKNVNYVYDMVPQKVDVGDRSAEGHQGLWEALPPVYRKYAVLY